MARMLLALEGLGIHCWRIKHDTWRKGDVMDNMDEHLGKMETQLKHWGLLATDHGPTCYATSQGRHCSSIWRSI
jgi:hypothetical protein